MLSFLFFIVRFVENVFYFLWKYARKAIGSLGALAGVRR
jgi:hypothetical protein